MKKNVIVCGVIAGILSSAWGLWAAAGTSTHIDFENGMWFGYASMILAFSLIFVAIKNYRDKYNNGLISFGKAFMIGLYITLIASTIYVGAWLIDYYVFMPEFYQVYFDHVLEKMKRDGSSQEMIDKQSAEAASMMPMLDNPFFVAMFTYFEILPVGLLISLIAAAILKKKNSVLIQSTVKS